MSLGYQGQNLAATDMTLIDAGRDFTYPLIFSSNGQAAASSAAVNVGGPGSVDILAGRTINLGFATGVTSTGNTKNGNLTAGGASITMIPGLGQQLDYADFLTNIIEPSSNYEAQLVTYVESITGQTGSDRAVRSSGECRACGYRSECVVQSEHGAGTGIHRQGFLQ